MTPQPVLQLDVPYPTRLSRGLIFVKWLLVIPHIVVLYAFQTLIGLTTLLAWFAILFTGRYPRGLFELARTYTRYSANVSAYMFLMRDEYPPFGSGAYPVEFEMDYPARLSRWKIFFKMLFIIPHLFVLYFLSIAASVVASIAWFAILITGRYPRGMFNFVAGTTRWGFRVQSYTLLMTDAYPPFTIAPVPSPTALAAGMA